MKDLLITDNYDLYISKDSADVQFTDSVIQAIKIRLNWFLGEWRINTNYGLPYYEEVFIKNPNAKLIASRVRKEILKVDEVTSVDRVTVAVDGAERKASITFEVTVDGESEEGEVLLNV